jgi:hypothetical protein
MKVIITSVIALLAVGVLSCSQPDTVISPSPFSGAKGSSGGGGTTTPPPTGTLPILAPNPTPINDLGPIMPTGTWKVKAYTRAFTNNTSDYAGYTFVFSPNNVVTATDGLGVSTSGIWIAYIGGQVSYYGGAASITAMTISFSKSGPKELYRLSALWNVHQATTTTDVVMDNFEPLSGERIEFGL